ncbi:unnamed protein product [Rodentolepis nana]|uniref:Uncharacterized protein n=1 Tax=Rodentolepis nana TaxID=102285 RepID=A0A3P7T2V5_RODNA|nr:unnamed protein product [Rodentolepis nana]
MGKLNGIQASHDTLEFAHTRTDYCLVDTQLLISRHRESEVNAFRWLPSIKSMPYVLAKFIDLKLNLWKYGLTTAV